MDLPLSSVLSCLRSPCHVLLCLPPDARPSFSVWFPSSASFLSPISSRLNLSCLPGAVSPLHTSVHVCVCVCSWMCVCVSLSVSSLLTFCWSRLMCLCDVRLLPLAFPLSFLFVACLLRSSLLTRERDAAHRVALVSVFLRTPHVPAQSRGGNGEKKNDGACCREGYVSHLLYHCLELHCFFVCACVCLCACVCVCVPLQDMVCASVPGLARLLDDTWSAAPPFFSHPPLHLLILLFQIGVVCVKGRRVRGAGGRGGISHSISSTVRKAVR